MKKEIEEEKGTANHVEQDTTEKLIRIDNASDLNEPAKHSSDSQLSKFLESLDVKQVSNLSSRSHKPILIND